MNRFYFYTFIIISLLITGCTNVEKNRMDELYSSRNIIKLWNKIDICRNKSPEGFIPVSSFTGEGFSEIEKIILETAYGGELTSLTDDAVIDSERQKMHIDNAVDALLEAEKSVKQDIPLDLIAPDIKEAMDNLGEITGEITSADILNNMFTKFCVGK